MLERAEKIEAWGSLFGDDMKGFEIQMAGKHEIEGSS